MYQLVHTSCMEAVKCVKMSCPSKNFGPHSIGWHWQTSAASSSCPPLSCLRYRSIYLSLSLSRQLFEAAYAS